MIALIKKFGAVLLVCAAISAALAVQNESMEQKLAALQKIQGKFTFIVLGDNRSGDDIYRKLIKDAMEYKPDFIVNTGDMIYAYFNLNVWKNFWEMSKPITVPYFLTAGNHDVSGSSSEEIYKNQVDMPGNELYYSFTAGNSLFVVLDSNLTGEENKIDGNQYMWLKKVLEDSKQKNKFVFVHHPLYPEKGLKHHFGSSLDRYPEKRDRLQSLFTKHNVTIVFTGHDHRFLRKKIDNVTQIITGGGGAPLYADEADGGFYHYVLITVKGDKISGEVIDINDKVRGRF